MTSFTLTIPGEPVGSGRPRFARLANGGVSARTPDKTRSYFERVHTEWIAAGRPRISGPWTVEVDAVFARPKGHYRANGSLSPKGRGLPFPTKKPDGDQILKVVTDPLVNVGAVPDDAACVEWGLTKRWAEGDEQAHVKVWVREKELPA